MCGWTESSFCQDNSGGLTIKQLRHLWELQIPAYPWAYGSEEYLDDVTAF
jgi:hypothetical protein